MRFLAVLLLLPWLLVLAWGYWNYPKSLPAHRSRRLFDLAVLLLAASAVVGGALLGFEGAHLPTVGSLGLPSGGIWQQVLPALLAYGGFSIFLILGLWLRQICWGARRR